MPNYHTFRDWPKTTLGVTVKKTFKKPKKPKKQKCLISATYASLAAAESSGDDWCDGAEITITGGPVFIYYEVLAVDGYSGLIHKEPYGAGNGTISASTYLASSPANTDPDAWSASWADTSTGVKGVDYELDVNAGRARLDDLTTAGIARMDYTPSDSANKEMFYVVDDVVAFHGVITFNQGAAINLAPQAANGTDWVWLVVKTVASLSSTNWVVNHGLTGGTNTATSKAFITPARIWSYAKQGRFAVWFDGDATPEVSGTDPRVIPGPTTLGIGFLQGGAGASSPSAIELGKQVLGLMSTA